MKNQENLITDNSVAPCRSSADVPMQWTAGSFFARENLPAITTLVLLLLTTIASWFFLTRAVEQRRQAHFDHQANQVVSNISVRLKEHEQILLGAAGLFSAMPEVNRSAFQQYVSSLMLEKNYPGILGVGFSKVIQRHDEAALTAKIKAEGYPQYTVHPQTTTPLLAPVIYIEPFVGRNLAAFGLDMFFEANRRNATLRAAGQGITTITDKVRLVQENQGKEQAGFLMYVPVYQNKMPLTTPAERMQALLGFSYSPYRMDDLMKGIMGNFSNELDFQIFARDTQSDANKMYDSADVKSANGSALYSSVEHINAYGETWLVLLTSKKNYDATDSALTPGIVLWMGLSIGLLVFFLMSAMRQKRDRAISLAVEMTREIRAQSEKIKYSEERFELAMRGSNDGLWDRNVELGTVYYSPRWKFMLGYENQDIPNTQEAWLTLVHPDDLEVILLKQARYQESKVERFQHEYRLRQKNGDYLWVLDRGFILFGEDGQLSRFVGMITDINERKRVDKLKSEFISTVSHELRTPLTSISASLGLLEAGVFGELPAKALGLVSIASKNSKRLTLLVNDILDMEKLVSGKTVFRSDQIDMMQLVKHAIELNNDYASSYGIQLSLVTTKGIHNVLGDKERLMQVMANLISNAVKFSFAGGVVEIRLEQKDKKVRVEIEDHGSGIPNEFQSRIFSEFAQADSSDTRQQGGTGLGLNITKKILERMEGEIGYSTIVGQGSIFWFALPYAILKGVSVRD